ncbi:MAG: hypothetical protein VCD00_13265 [Candidatus Hydrogenedentota bacterium]
MKRLLVGLMMSIFAVGCIPEKPEDDATTVTPQVAVVDALSEEEILIEEWLAMAAEPDSHVGDVRPFQICDELAQMGPTALAPFVELLDDSEASGATKIFVLQSINVNMSPAYIPQLTGLLDSGDQTARSCAVSLLGGIHDDAVAKLLLGLKDDDNSRVAFSALSGLAQQTGEPYRTEFVDLYFADDATRARKSEIFRVILMRTQASDLPVLEAEVADPETVIGIRLVATMLLGNFGDLDSIPELEKSLEIVTDEQYRQLAQSTIAALQERFKA